MVFSGGHLPESSCTSSPSINSTAYGGVYFGFPLDKRVRVDSKYDYKKRPNLTQNFLLFLYMLEHKLGSGKG
jgi:hypothetical protein